MLALASGKRIQQNFIIFEKIFGSYGQTKIIYKNSVIGSTRKTGSKPDKAIFSKITYKVQVKICL